MHIIHQDRFFLLDSTVKDDSGKRFIPAHKNFRVVAIAAPVPPYTGYPIDPPFRSRFQARFVDPVGALISLSSSGPELSDPNSSKLYSKLQEIILATQYASEASNAVDVTARSNLRAFPQTALAKLRALLAQFPAPPSLSPYELAKLVLALHPGLLHAPFVVWAMLSHQTEEAGLGPLGSPSLTGEGDGVGLLGYKLVSIERESDRTIRVTFANTLRADTVTLSVPGGPRPLLPYPWSNTQELDFIPTDRFTGLLTSLLQAHALGWDISYVPPVLPSTASCSTTTLVQTFGAVLGYEVDSVYVYKELGGRELIMRRKIEDGGATSWEPR